jgi:DNA-directed RNA polymerase specialized sigma24 family protein
LLGSLADAEDALQEAIGAWKGLASFEGRSSLRSWLYRVTTNAHFHTRRVDQRADRIFGSKSARAFFSTRPMSFDRSRLLVSVQRISPDLPTGVLAARTSGRSNETNISR